MRRDGSGRCDPSGTLDGLAKSHPLRWLRKKAKVKARALTTTRRAGGLDFRPAAEKTKARQCLQRYVCESKPSRGVRRTLGTPQRQSAAGGKRNAEIGLFTKPSNFKVGATGYDSMPDARRSKTRWRQPRFLLAFSRSRITLGSDDELVKSQPKGAEAPHCASRYCRP